MGQDRSTTVEQVSDREVRVTRSFDAPPDAVFAAWSRADLFRRWWAPASMGASITACEIDARVGGGYRITFGGEADGTGGMTFFGRYLEADPPNRLAWTNEETPDGPVTTVTFEDQAGRTRLTLSERHPAAAPADALETLRAMAPEQFGQLDALLAELTVGG